MQGKRREGGGGGKEEFQGGGGRRKRKEISTLSHADRQMELHLLHIPILNFFVDFLCNSDKEGLPDFAYVEAVAPLEGIEPVASDMALICY